MKSLRIFHRPASICDFPSKGRAWVRMLPVLMGLLLLAISTETAQAQEEDQGYDEIPVFLIVQRVGSAEISAVISDEQAYLPVSEVFDFLKIRNIVSAGLDSVTGSFINPQTAFLVDYPNSRIMLDGKNYPLPSGSMIRTETNLYLHSKYFGQIFGLNCNFSYRGLAVLLDTKLELPVIREMRLEQMRNNLRKLKGEKKVDTVFNRTYPAFHFGMADWSVISSQNSTGKSDTRLNLALGATIAGGEANASLIYYNNQPFREKQQQYLWRFANNDFKVVKQVMAGKINTQATSSIYSPVVGVQVTNTPTTFRRSFGSYTLTDKTEPGWTVELYVNNVLVDYVKADASGLFTFEVPLVYGNSSVTLKFYGPWGEEHSKEQNVSIPFNFLPKGELQYTAGAGIVEDSLGSRFSRVNMNYGLGNRLTVGAGTEYLSSVTSGEVMPFVNGSVRLASSLLLTGDYTYGVRSRQIITYRFPSNLQFEVYLTQYEKGQKAINYNYLEERKAVVSMPLRTKNFSAFSRFTLNQIILPESKYTTTELMLSGAFYGVSTNLTTYAMFIDPANPYTYSNLSLSFRLPASFLLIPQLQYEYNHNKLISLKCGIEKHIFRNGFFNLSYEKNFKSNIQNIEFGLKYDLSFAQLAFSARRVNKTTMLTESARGSLIVDAKNSYVHAGNRNSVGKGGAVVVPFLDLNCNGVYEKGEPRVPGLQVHLNGGRMEIDQRDTSIRIFDLEPYATHFIEFDRNSFDNIAWRIRHSVVSVAIDPNQFRLIEVPISVLGEASGMVYLKGPKGTKGQGRILVDFYRMPEGKLAGKTLTEQDGYFSLLNFPPGKYVACIDSAQLQKIRMQAQPQLIPFEINQSIDGDVIDGLEFILQSTITGSLDMAQPSGPATGDNSAEEIAIPGSGNQTSSGGMIASEKGNVLQEPVTPIATSGKTGAREITDKPETNEQPVGGYNPVKEPEPVNTPKPEARSMEVPASGSDDPDSMKDREYSGGYGIQVGAFQVKSNAESCRARLIDALTKEVVIREMNGFSCVIVKGFHSKSDAMEFLPVLRNRGYVSYMIVKAD